MVASAIDYLGIGMYTPAEAAMYARISSRMMSRWVHGDGSGEAAIRAQIPDDESKTITFLDFVQTLSLRAIREQKSVPLQKIRQVIEYAASKGVTYPFARQHQTFLLGDEVLIQVDPFGLLQASGKQRGQLTLRPIVEPFMKDLCFNTDGLADHFTAFESQGVKIVMSPKQRFGEPVVETSGYTAWSLWEAAHAEGSIEGAAKAYGVPETEVLVAYKFIDSIRPATTA